MSSEEQQHRNAVAAAVGVKGFDANARVSYDVARKFVDHDYRFAVRYVPRVQAAASDLSSAEVDDLLRAGLAVMPVQHVESESSWTPTDDKGRNYGDAAAYACRVAGLPPGVTVWLDLEGVAPRADGTFDAEQITRYCNLWYDAVAAMGFQPGLYVGWHAGLTPDELYALKFTRYWSAYNLNADQCPATCGVCMRQHVAGANDVPPDVRFPIDTDTVVGDAKGRVPMVCAPDEWDS
jgi:hypothetical protein